MKRTVFLTLFACIVLIACKSKPDHHVRVKNLTDREISIRIDDTVEFNKLAPQMRSEYKPVAEGAHNIEGDYIGNFFVDGNGTHKWTIFIKEDNFEIKED